MRRLVFVLHFTPPGWIVHRRWLAASLCASAMACGHKLASAGGMLALRSQLLIQARQPRPRASCCKPGKASQPTPTQRLRACTMVCPVSTFGGVTAVVAGAGPCAVEGVGARSSTGALVGLLAQPPRLPTINATTTGASNHPMTLIILEALGAGVLLVGIVWWTMFSGRKNGELPPAPADDEMPPKP